MSSFHCTNSPTGTLRVGLIQALGRMTINLSSQPERSPEAILAITMFEMARFSDPLLAAALQPFLIAPRMEPRTWDWSTEALEFPTWVVAESQRYDYGIVYAENGFGPDSPWGLVFSSHKNFGADYCWYTSLQAAFVDSRLLEEHQESQGASAA